MTWSRTFLPPTTSLSNHSSIFRSFLLPPFSNLPYMVHSSLYLSPSSHLNPLKSLRIASHLTLSSNLSVRLSLLERISCKKNSSKPSHHSRLLHFGVSNPMYRFPPCMMKRTTDSTPPVSDFYYYHSFYSTWTSSSPPTSSSSFSSTSSTLLPSSSPTLLLSPLSPMNNFSSQHPISRRVLNLLPVPLHPYFHLARLSSPIGTLLLLFPCTYSLIMATYGTSLPLSSLGFHLIAFTLGAFLMRGAGCTLNDLWDRHLDSQVERTKNRPLASGALSPRQGLGFLSTQLSLGSLILFQFNLPSIILGLGSLPLIALYPLAKRVTHYPQLVLGATFNWGALLGWMSLTSSWEPTILIPLYFSGVTWTLIYDTVYAFQDSEWDAKIGIKSTALLWNNSGPLWLGLLTGVSGLSLSLAGWMNDQGWPFYLGVLSSTGVLYYHHVLRISYESNQKGRARIANDVFRSNKWVGGLVVLGLLGDLFRRRIQNEEAPVPITRERHGVMNCHIRNVVV